MWKGVELTICVATNDAYVMEVSKLSLGSFLVYCDHSPYFTSVFFRWQAWGRTSGGADAGIRFLSDATGDMTKAFGLEMDTPTMLRTKRFSLVADGNVVTHYFSSEKESSHTWAPAVLSALWRSSRIDLQ